MPSAVPHPQRFLQRYAIYEPFAAGGMATVHFGRLVGAGGFSRAVAIKQLHPDLAADPEFATMLADEARLAARIQQSNVIRVLDVIANQGQLFLVLEYVHGPSLAFLLRRAPEPPRPEIAAAIVYAVLEGLHAAHEARDAGGQPLDIVHRDVSPQNVLVDATGVAKLLDFGVAKARARAQRTREGQLKGKLAYMAPEQLRGEATRRSDVFAASAVLWEALTGRRLFEGVDDAEVRDRIFAGAIEPPGRVRGGVPPELDAVVMRALAIDPLRRFATAREMSFALAKSIPLATPLEIGSWVAALSGPELEDRAKRLAQIEAAPLDLGPASTGAAVHAAPVARATRGDDAPRELVTQPTAHVPGLARPAPRTSGSPRARRIAGSAVAVVTVSALAASLQVRATASNPSPAVAPAPTQEALVPAEPAAADVPPAAPIAPAAANEPRTRSVTRPTTVARPGRARPSCTPAFVVDAAGVRHYKPECLK